MKKIIYQFNFFPLVLILLLGCSQFDEKTEGIPVKQDDSNELIMTKDKIGNLDSSTEFDSSVIKNLLIGYDVTKGSGSKEGVEFPVINVIKEGNTMLRITPSAGGEIKSIEILSNKVNNNLGPRVGDSYNDLLGKNLVYDLKPGTKELSGTVVGKAVGAQNISYVFSGKYKGDDKDIPPLEVFEKWKISKIIWKK